jgi:hypothetical protein
MDNSASIPTEIYFIGKVCPPDARADADPDHYQGSDARTLSWDEKRRVVDESVARRKLPNPETVLMDLEHERDAVNGRISTFFIDGKDNLACIGYLTDPASIRDLMQEHREGLSVTLLQRQHKDRVTRDLLRVALVQDPWYAKENTYIKFWSTEPKEVLRRFREDFAPAARYVHPEDRAAVESLSWANHLDDPASRFLDPQTRRYFGFPDTSSHAAAKPRRILASWTRRSKNSGTQALSPEEAQEILNTYNAPYPGAVTSLPMSTSANFSSSSAAATAQSSESTGAVPMDTTGSSSSSSSSAASQAMQQQQQQQTSSSAAAQSNSSFGDEFLSSMLGGAAPGNLAAASDLGERARSGKRAEPEPNPAGTPKTTPSKVPANAKTTESLATPSPVPPDPALAGGDPNDLLRKIQERAEEVERIHSRLAGFEKLVRENPKLAGLDPAAIAEAAAAAIEERETRAAKEWEATVERLKTGFADEWTADLEQTIASKDEKTAKIFVSMLNAREEKARKSQTQAQERNQAAADRLNELDKRLDGFRPRTTAPAQQQQQQQPASNVPSSMRTGGAQTNAVPPAVPAAAPLVTQSSRTAPVRSPAESETRASGIATEPMSSSSSSSSYRPSAESAVGSGGLLGGPVCAFQRVTQSSAGGGRDYSTPPAEFCDALMNLMNDAHDIYGPALDRDLYRAFNEEPYITSSEDIRLISERLSQISTATLGNVRAVITDKQSILRGAEFVPNPGKSARSVRGY